MNRRLMFALVTAAALVAAGPAVHGSWLTKIRSEAGDAGRSAARRAAGGLDDAAGHVKSLPAETGRSAVAAARSQEGHWTFVNRAGETYTAGTPSEMKRALGVLGVDAAADSRLVIALSEDTVFRYAGALGELPVAAELKVVVKGQAYPLRKAVHIGREGLFADVRPTISVALTDRRLFDEAVWQLARPLVRTRVRVISLAAGGPQRLGPVARVDGMPGAQAVDRLDPFHLAPALAAARGQTVVVTGRLADDVLTVRPAGGSEVAIPLADLRRAAASGDVNLMLLNTASGRQPGARNWFWQKVSVDGLDTALSRPQMADFLAGLAGDRGRLIVSAREGSSGRVSLQAIPTGTASVIPAPGGLGDLFAELVSGVTGQIATAAIEADVVESGRRSELDLRIVPWLHSDFQYGYVGLLLAGLIGLPVALGWWRRVWPPEARDEYAGAIGFQLARLARWVLFALAFLPLAGLPAAITHIVMQAWSVLTFPFRLIGRLLRSSRARPSTGS